MILAASLHLKAVKQSERSNAQPKRGSVAWRPEPWLVGCIHCIYCVQTVLPFVQTSTGRLLTLLGSWMRQKTGPLSTPISFFAGNIIASTWLAGIVFERCKTLIEAAWLLPKHPISNLSRLDSRGKS